MPDETVSSIIAQADGELDAIGLRTGTDKSTRYHGYLTVYEQVLSHLRHEEMVLIEIGVGAGSSTLMWHEYFPRAQIVGVDHSREALKVSGDRITIEIGPAGDPQFLSSLVDKYDPLVVIDDGTHQWRHQIQAFEQLYPALRAGGVYVVEDVHTSFGSYATTYGKGSEVSAFDYVARISRQFVAGAMADPPADEFEAYCRETLESVTLLRHSLIARKKPTAGRMWRRADLAQYLPESGSTELGSYDRIDLDLIGGSPWVTRAADMLRTATPVRLPAAHSQVLKDVTVVGGGMALTPDGHVLSESVNCIENLPVYRGFDRQFQSRGWAARSILVPHRVPKEPGRQYVLLKSAWDRNFGHWLFDTLPKLALLGDLRLDLPPRFILNPHTGAMAEVVRATLALAGYGEADVVYHDFEPRQYESLGVLGALSWHPVKKAPLAVRYLENLTKEISPGSHERIYLSRNAYSRRRLLDEEELMPLLEDNGFVRVHTETMTFLEQVALFKGARVVAGNMGAAFASLAFSPPGVQVIALATPAMPHDFFYDIACHKAGRYLGLQGESGDERPDMSSDFTLGNAKLERALSWMQERKQ